MEARAVALLLSRERPRFVRLARRRLPSEADADEVVQQAMARATERAGSLDDPARLRGWFGSILRRAIADFYRARGPETATVDEEVADEPVESPGRPCACSLRLLEALRPAYAEVLRRVDLEGEAPEAAATALGITTTNLHVRLHRARRALRDRVGAHCGVTSAAPCLDCTCDASSTCGARARELTG